MSVHVYPVKPFIWYMCTCLVNDTASNSWTMNLKGFSDAASWLDFFHYFNILSKIPSWCLPPVSHSETLPCSPVRNQTAGDPCDHLVTVPAQYSLQKITVIFFFLQKAVFFLCTLKSITKCHHRDHIVCLRERCICWLSSMKSWVRDNYRKLCVIWTVLPSLRTTDDTTSILFHGSQRFSHGTVLLYKVTTVQFTLESPGKAQQMCSPKWP